METQRVHYTELAPSAPHSLHAREMETYRREVGRLLAEGRAGEFVLIHDDDVVGFWPTRKEALVEGFRRFREGLFTVDEVREWHEVMVIQDRGRLRWLDTDAQHRSPPARSYASASSSVSTETLPKH